MRPTDPHERPEPTALDRREFLRLGGTLAAASALALLVAALWLQNCCKSPEDSGMSGPVNGNQTG